MELQEATLALARAEGFHARQLRDPDLLQDPRCLIGRPAAELIELGIKPRPAAWLSSPDPVVLAEDQRWVEAEKLQLLRWGGHGYPGRLAAIADPPAVLFMRGPAANLMQPQLAVIGSRHPTPAGRRIAQDFSAWLADAGLVVTSGLARGIDAAAHEGALQNGRTIAVVGTGLDRVYPTENRALHDRILAAGGTVVSEFERGRPPLAPNFPQRNRIISALSLGVLIVEAARQSGSLITARLAGDQGREVYVVPGSILSPQSQGCHALIRQGARLVESAEEILADLGLHYIKQDLTGSSAPSEPPGSPAVQLDKGYEILLDALGFDLVGVDELIARTGLCSQSLAQMLLTLELAGTVALHSGGRYQRVR
jgi:DNA processing protein